MTWPSYPLTGGIIGNFIDFFQLALVIRIVLYLSTVKRTFLLILGTFSVLMSFCQKELKPTQSFTITGEVKSPVTVQASNLKKWSVQTIGDVAITNHLGEKKSEEKALKGVLLKDVLQSVEINAESPKVLSEYYVVCKSNDGYTVVYSWNELFNSPTGNSAYLVTEQEGKPLTEMNDAILMISTGDFKTGRRHVKALTSIEIKRAGR